MGHRDRNITQHEKRKMKKCAVLYELETNEVELINLQDHERMKKKPLKHVRKALQKMSDVVAIEHFHTSICIFSQHD